VAAFVTGLHAMRIPLRSTPPAWPPAGIAGIAPCDRHGDRAAKGKPYGAYPPPAEPRRHPGRPSRRGGNPPGAGAAPGCGVRSHAPLVFHPRDAAPAALQACWMPLVDHDIVTCRRSPLSVVQIRVVAGLRVWPAPPETRGSTMPIRSSNRRPHGSAVFTGAARLAALARTAGGRGLDERQMAALWTPRG